MRPPARALLTQGTLTVLFAVLLGCGPSTGETSGLSGGDLQTTVEDDSTSTSSSTEVTGASSSGSGSGSTQGGSTTGTSAGVTTEDQPGTDVGSPTSGEAASGCNEKIDILFFLSDGYLVEDILDVSTPKFLKTMEEELAEFDLHVMVVDPSGEWGDDVRCPKNMCPADGGCPAEGFEDFPCWALHEEGALTKCDNTRGAGLVFPAGVGAANKPCGVPEGRRYITNSDPNFAEAFSCLSGRSGGSGGVSEHGTTLGRALAFDLKYGCNEGFVRDDALLLVVQVVQQSYDEMDPPGWAEFVLEAKGFEQNMVVALGVAIDWEGYEPMPLCDGAKFRPERAGFSEWVTYFEHSVFASRCEANYAPFFAEAASMAADLCRPVPG